MGFVRSNAVIAQTEVTYLFVDGNWLRHTLSDLSERWFHCSIHTDFRALKDETRAMKCFYYDAFPPENDADFKDETKRKEEEFAAISALPGWHVITGLTRGKKGSGQRLRQKGVDLKLGIDAIIHRIRGNFDRAVIIAGDLDFLPLVNALVELGAWVELWCDPTKTPKDLYLAADSRVWIGIPSVSPRSRFKPSGRVPGDPVWDHPINFVASGVSLAKGFDHERVYDVRETAEGGEVVATDRNGEITVWKHADAKIQLYYLRSMHPHIQWDIPHA